MWIQWSYPSLSEDVVDEFQCKCAEFCSYSLSVPQVSRIVCAVHGAELATEMVISERETLVSKHEKHLNSQRPYALTSEQN